MAKLLVRTVDGENAQRFMRGDIVGVFPDEHVWGRMESLKVWKDEGNPPILWPGGFMILELTGLSTTQARNYLVRSGNRRCDFTIDINDILSKISQAKRDIYESECRMTFSWSNLAVREYIKAKL